MQANPYESKQQAEPCKQKKRGRKPKLTEEDRKANKNERDRNYRKYKKAKSEESEKKNEELEKKVAAHLSEINSLKADLSKARDQFSPLLFLLIVSFCKVKIKDRADKLERKMSEMSDESKKVKMAGKVLESEMLPLQPNILDSDDQENSAENCEFNIPMDVEYLNSLDPDMLGNFDAWLDPQSSKTKGTTIAKAKLPPPLLETVNVSDFNVRKENSAIIQEIFSQYPNIASCLQVHRQALRDCFMNILAEVYKMAIKKKHTLEEIKSMEKDIKDLELAGLEISWLKDLVKMHKEVVRKGKNKKTLRSI